MKKSLVLYKSFMGFSAIAAAAAFVFYCFVPDIRGSSRIVMIFMQIMTALWFVFAVFECGMRTPLFFRLSRTVRIVICSVLAAGLLLSLSLETQILSFSSRHELSDRAEAILILGAGLRGSRPSGSLQCRLEEAVKLAHLAPHLPVIVSGGRGPDEEYEETLVMSAWLTERGISPDRIIPESKSRTTRENFRFSRRMFPWRNPEKPCAYVVTNSFHEFRACLTGRDHGWACIPWAAPDYPLTWPVMHVREQMAILKHLLHPARFQSEK